MLNSSEKRHVAIHGRWYVSGAPSGQQGRPLPALFVDSGTIEHVGVGSLTAAHRPTVGESALGPDAVPKQSP